MSITFPINPQQGQQYTPPGIPVTWQFDVGRNAWRVMRTPPLWSDIANKPASFPPSEHEHEIGDVAELQNTLNIKQDITARGLPSGYAPLDETGVVPSNMLPPGVATGEWDDLTGKPSTFPPSPHSHPVVEINDSTSTGQQLVRAAGAFAARQIIGAIGPDDNARLGIDHNGVQVGMRRTLNFIEGDNITIEVTDDVANEEVDVKITSAGGGAAGAGFISSDVKPAAPFNDDQWFDSATGLTFIYYNDGVKAQWIESIPYLSTIPATFTKFVFPTAPTNGQTYEPVAGARWKWSSTRGVWFAMTPVADAYTKTETDAKFVDLAGDAMTGVLTLNADPTADFQAATKKYVDTTAASAGTGKVNRSGDTMTGQLNLKGQGAVAVDAAGSAGFFFNTTGHTNRFFFGASSNEDILSLYNFGTATSRALTVDGVTGVLNFPQGGTVPNEPAGSSAKIANTAYVETRAQAWADQQVANRLIRTGDAMTGQLTTAGSNGVQSAGSAGALQVMSVGTGGHATISFHVPGSFGGNIAMDSVGSIYYGGWSYGATYYRFWSDQLCGYPISNARLAHFGDFYHGSGAGTQEPYNGGIVGAAAITMSAGMTLRYRALQVLTSSWWSVGYG